jgi:hypothetical protein
VIKIIVYINLFCFARILHSQVSMKEKLDLEFNEKVKEMKIKSMTEWTFSLNPSIVSNLEYVQNSITYQANFDSIGNCIYKVKFYDSTSMEQEYYWYDKKGRLTRTVKANSDTLNMTYIIENNYNTNENLSRIYNYLRNDSRDSLIDRIEFYYNKKNQLVTQMRYYSSSDYCYFMDSVFYNKKGDILNIKRFKNSTKNNEAKYHTETEYYHYDKNDNLVSKIIIDPSDQSVDFKNEYLYDKKGRVIDSKFFSDDYLSHHFTYIYNKDGTLSFMSENQNSNKYVYENGIKKQVITYNWNNQPSIVKVYDYEFY